MYIQEKSSRGSDLIPLETKLMGDRIIFIEDEITTETACLFMKQLLVLNQFDTEAPIRVLINSHGGEINAGLLMHDLIQSSEAPIQTYCTGRAYSMAAVLFACGRHGRYMLPYSELMIHKPLLGNQIGGNAATIKSFSDILVETEEKITRILAKHTGKTLRAVEKAMSYEHFFSAEESVEFGLCDKIMSFDKIIDRGYDNEIG